MLNLVELYINLRSWTRPSGFSWSDSRGQNHRHWCVLSVMWITRLVTKPTQNFFKISAIWLPQQALYRTMLFSQFCKLKSSQCDSLLPLPVMNISDYGKHFISKKKLKYNSMFLVLTQCCAHFESVWTQRILLGRARKDSCFILLIPFLLLYESQRAGWYQTLPCCKEVGWRILWQCAMSKVVLGNCLGIPKR